MLLEDLQVILKVAEFKSITAAASNLDMRTATASAAVKRVEQALGFELFIRTTRHLRLSAAGERYIPQCQQAVTMLEQAKNTLKSDDDIIDGELRIALSSDLGRNIVIPWLDEFMQTHTQLSLRANISDSNIDFYRDSVDIALRYGKPNDASMYGFKICDVPRILCAAQSYLDTHGTPAHPHDLTSHKGLFYQLQDIIKDVWLFSNGSEEFKVKLNGGHATNDGDLVRRWCVSGKGLAVKSCLDMSNELLAGNVVSVMPSFKPTPTELWLVCPSRQSITPAVRLLRDAFREKSAGILKALIAKGIIDKSVLG
ncbi:MULTISPECIES: LysR family transcriptional regulator [unclassified Pseudoalteromonas]|uniref:LysR family transcriptional regulator n=1 Tax=unclassified Pseudoalteromonas TaxID=194690 RepID=UPI0006D66CDD|nr:MULTISPECIES: LysR family transcriptional regulator [unclassified Pseudoalteromonas]KPZ53099.1 HTH-type transcriptional regulator DmlR [Pseudoalteromonas sp. P1-25]KPZ57339.1 HTH-type transcriptional regulator DmlR [Pseudoalteromonas sp. P1-13-1a]KPZ60975.1 HTH-type transcriptional regulator DmlR [Pseudoalteromonas sp. P1-7a]